MELKVAVTPVMLLSLSLLPVIFGQSFLSKPETSSPKSLSWGKDEILSLSDKCFCKLEGQIDDCSCQVNTVDDFNNKKIYPRLKSDSKLQDEERGQTGTRDMWERRHRLTFNKNKTNNHSQCTNGQGT